MQKDTNPKWNADYVNTGFSVPFTDPEVYL